MIIHCALSATAAASRASNNMLQVVSYHQLNKTAEKTLTKPPKLLTEQPSILQNRYFLDQ